MTKRKLLSLYFNTLVNQPEIDGQAVQVLYLYTRDKLSEKQIALRLGKPLYQIRKQLNKLSFVATKVSGDKEYLKAMEILRAGKLISMAV